jgi:hypothetical protein
MRRFFSLIVCLSIVYSIVSEFPAGITSVVGANSTNRGAKIIAQPKSEVPASITSVVGSGRKNNCPA